WGTGGTSALSVLGVWLIRLGIRLSYSRPAHPQTNGKAAHRPNPAGVISHLLPMSSHTCHLCARSVHLREGGWRELSNKLEPPLGGGLGEPCDTPKAGYSARLCRAEYLAADDAELGHHHHQWLVVRLRCEVRVGDLGGRPRDADRGD